MPVQCSGANLRGFLNDGVPKLEDQQWFAAPAIIATNELVGFRILPNLWEHIRGAAATRREGVLNTMAYFLEDAGMTFAPLIDRRQSEGTRLGSEVWSQPGINYARADGSEFKCRMAEAQKLTSEWQMRALMHPTTLNVMLSLYCGLLQSRNCVVVCHEVSTAAPGEGKDRARLYHRREKAIPFRWGSGKWWWVNATKRAWCPTTGNAGSMPPLNYMDVGAIYVPAEVEWRRSSGDFMVWSMVPQTENKETKVYEEAVKSDLLGADNALTTMLMMAWGFIADGGSEAVAK